jgi:hypothetical protein
MVSFLQTSWKIPCPWQQQQQVSIIGLSLGQNSTVAKLSCIVPFASKPKIPPLIATAGADHRAFIWSETVLL